MIAMKLDKADLARVMKALKSVRYRLKWQAEVDGGEMNRRCSIGYAQLLVRNIMTQKHTGGYAPYHPRYRQFKQDYFAGGWWKLKGDLVKNIVNFRDGRGWTGGVPAGVFDTGGKSWVGMGRKGKPKRIAMYARVGEYGGRFGRGGDHPARPIFTPTMEEYAGAEWPRQGELALKNVEGAWK